MDQLENRIIIRRMSDDDINCIADIYEKCFGVRRLPKSVGNLMLYVAVLDDNIVGMCQIDYLYLLYEEEKIAYVNSVCVHSDYQNRGIARVMLSKVLDICKSDGCTKSILTCNSKRVYANKLYKSLGYEKSMTNLYFKMLK